MHGHRPQRRGGLSGGSGLRDQGDRLRRRAQPRARNASIRLSRSHLWPASLLLRTCHSIAQCCSGSLTGSSCASMAKIDGDLAVEPARQDADEIGPLDDRGQRPELVRGIDFARLRHQHDIAEPAHRGDVERARDRGMAAPSGHTFLIVDANGTAGYQAGTDIVIDVTGLYGSVRNRRIHLEIAIAAASELSQNLVGPRLCLWANFPANSTWA